MAKCIGCGIKLQTQNEEALGYVPFIDEENGCYCKRCYQIIHNGRKYKPVLTCNDYYQKISIIKNKEAYVLLMIDIMDIFGGFIPNLKNYIGNNKVVILVNKVDVMPKSVHLKRVEQAIREKAYKEGLNLSGVLMISAKKLTNIEIVLHKILKMHDLDLKKSKTIKEKKSNQCKEIYLLGCASVGKSTFVNAVKKKYLNDERILTTSDQFQTTQDFIKIAIDQNNFLIDTPGLINEHSYGAYLDYESVKLLTPKNYIKPKTFQLNPEQTLFLGGLARIDFLSGVKLNVSLYVANDLNVHRTKRINATKLYDNHLTTLLFPPSEEEKDKIKEWKMQRIENKTGTYDLIISGVGIIHIVCENMTIEVGCYEKIDCAFIEGFI